MFRSDLNRYGEPDSAIFGNNRALIVGWGETNLLDKDKDIKFVQTAIQQKLEMPAVSSRDCVAQWNQTLGFDLSGIFL